MSFLRRIWDRIRGKRRGPRHGVGVVPARSRANAARAICRIRRATHPDYRDDGGRGYFLHPGERKIGRDWAIRSPWHNGAWIAGWYVANKRTCHTCANPANLADYNCETEIHEVAHDIEFRLRLTPPWHYAPWAAIFEAWHDLPARAALDPTGPDDRMRALDLPGVEPGDLVAVDFVGGESFACVAGAERTA